MKIGILTLKYKANYGGILQMLSLYSYLRGLGHEVTIIDLVRTEFPTRLKMIFQSLVNLLTSGNPYRTFMDRKIEENIPRGEDSTQLIVNNNRFLKDNFVFTKEVSETSISTETNEFDAIIVGSDQVWSVTSANALSYFIDWNYKGRRIVYAACSVKETPYLFNRRKISKLIKQFDAVSVRDNTTRNFVLRVSNIKPLVVCDPTLLTDFVPLLGKPLINGKYIFIYILGSDITGGGQEAIRKIKEKVGDIPVVSAVIPSNSLVGKQLSDKTYDDLTPLQWLNLLYYSSFVYTDSFHGTIYSIHYRKNFLSYYKSAKRATRLIDLVDRFYLQKHLIDAINTNTEIIYPVDYTKSNIELERFVGDSEAFFSKTLS